MAYHREANDNFDRFNFIYSCIVHSAELSCNIHNVYNLFYLDSHYINVWEIVYKYVVSI